MRVGRTILLFMVGAALWAPPAGARTVEPLGLTDCAQVEGLWQCSGLVPSWDGVPLDATVTLPAAGGRNMPLVAAIHGFGNSKWEYMDPGATAYTDNVYAWARDGYAVLSYTARGLWGSCGTPESRSASPGACASGYIHLADTRYEVRDTQELIGRLVDEGIAAADRIGVTGDSYGGGQSLALAALADRKMLPDGTLTPWLSPKGTPLRIAVAAPVIPWSDLINAAAPNGHVFTDAITPRRVATEPVGVEKASFVNGIFAAAQVATGPGQPLGEPFVPGRPMGYLAPAGSDPDADVAGWVGRTDQGEPYDDASARTIVEQLTRFHSAYYIDSDHRPPPLFLASGFTDDLFPVDEVVRFANRTVRRYPGLPVRLFLGDFGHQRASNVPGVRARLLASIHRWFDRRLLGRGPRLHSGVTAWTSRCPRAVEPRRPFRARYFERLARGEVRLRDTSVHRVASDGGDPQVAVQIDPVAGGGDACAEVTAEPAAGTAVYQLPKPPRRYTLIGAPTVIARMRIDGAAAGVAELAVRLWDVAPGGGSQRLVTRGLWRPAGGRNTFQLHPGAWTFRPGHHAKLELVGRDAPYARPSNGTYTVEVSHLRLRLPVRRRPDCRVVFPRSRSVRPAGTAAAPGSRPLRGRRAIRPRSCRR